MQDLTIYIHWPSVGWLVVYTFAALRDALARRQMRVASVHHVGREVIVYTR